MKNNKIGTIFLISMLALAGVGISYAGFTDVISIYGTVDTATVNIELVDYSGTDVWKVYGDGAPTGEIYIFRGFISDPERPTTEAEVLAITGGEHAILVSSAWASAGTDYDVNMVWDNIFPCIDFTADVIIHYAGSIPAKVSNSAFVWDGTGYNFGQYTNVKYYWYTIDNGALIKGQEITTLPVQMHNCEYIGIEVTIHLAQDNALQDKSGAFSFDIQAIQWNEQLPYQYYVPTNIGSGSLTVIGTGWTSVSEWLNPTGYDFANNRYSYDLTDRCQPIALQGFVDTTETAVVNSDDWSKYYAKFSIRDSNNNLVEVVFGNDWLGNWYEMAAQPWDRIRMENNMGLTQPSQYYAKIGGVVDRDMDGNWVGTGNGATIYPSNQIYFFQLIADPIAKTFTLQVYAMGSSAPANPPNAWPTQNMYDYATWLEIGSITVGASNFNFAAVEFFTILWASTQAGADETSTVSWNGMHIGVPLDFSEVP